MLADFFWHIDYHSSAGEPVRETAHRVYVIVLPLVISHIRFVPVFLTLINHNVFRDQARTSGDLTDGFT